jgi:hypothetical protein
VRFDTSAGTFVVAGAPPARQVTVTADSSGLAAVDLQSEKSVVTAHVRITALDAGRDLEVAFTRVNPADIIAIIEPRSLTPADGVTTVRITARVASDLPAGRRRVTFRTSLGGFVPGRVGEFSAEADGSDSASADLSSLVSGEAHVTATVDGSTSETYVRFIPALPDRILLGISSATLRAGGSVTITVTLLRSIGTVTARLPVELSAETERGAAIGTFSGNAVAENGVASITFYPGQTLYVGAVVIRASVEGGAAGTARIDILP